MVGLRFVWSSLRRIVKVLLKSEHFPNLKPFFSRSLTKHPEGSKPVPHSKDDLLFFFFFVSRSNFPKKKSFKSHKSFCLIYVSISPYCSLYFSCLFLKLMAVFCMLSSPTIHRSLPATVLHWPGPGIVGMNEWVEDIRCVTFAGNKGIPGLYKGWHFLPNHIGTIVNHH